MRRKDGCVQLDSADLAFRIYRNWSTVGTPGLNIGPERTNQLTH